MQKVNITDKFLALIEREKLVSFNELSKEEKEILEFYNFYHIENSIDFYELVSFYNDQARKPLIFRLGDEWLIHKST